MSTGNTGLDALADAIAERVIARMQAGKPDRLLTVGEAAKYLGRSARAVRHLIAAGTLPVVRDGRSVHLDRPRTGPLIELRQWPGVRYPPCVDGPKVLAHCACARCDLVDHLSVDVVGSLT